MGRFKLVIFDMDDTLVSSGSTWKQAEMKLYDHIGCPYSAEAASAYKGLNAMDVGRTIHRFCQPDDLSAEDCGRMLREWLLDGFRTQPVNPMPGADDLLKRLNGRIDMVVASGSPADGIRSVLDKMGWTEYFKMVISSEEVAKGKPEPDVFIEAARRMGCAPEDALIIEDSLHGLHAAKSAGMACYVVPSSDDPRIADGADRSYPSLDRILTEDIVG
ncbi:MAG: HAD family hydrolase [Armatimonadota bacterium]